MNEAGHRSTSRPGLNEDVRPFTSMDEADFIQNRLDGFDDDFPDEEPEDTVLLAPRRDFSPAAASRGEVDDTDIESPFAQPKSKADPALMSFARRAEGEAESSARRADVITPVPSPKTPTPIRTLKHDAASSELLAPRSAPSKPPADPIPITPNAEKRPCTGSSPISPPLVTPSPAQARMARPTLVPSTTAESKVRPPSLRRRPIAEIGGEIAPPIDRRPVDHPPKVGHARPRRAPMPPDSGPVRSHDAISSGRRSETLPRTDQASNRMPSLRRWQLATEALAVGRSALPTLPGAAWLAYSKACFRVQAHLSTLAQLTFVHGCRVAKLVGLTLARARKLFAQGIEHGARFAWTATDFSTRFAWKAVNRGVDALWKVTDLSARFSWKAANRGVATLWTATDLGARFAWKAINHSADALWTATDLSARSAWKAINRGVDALWRGTDFSARFAWKVINRGVDALWRGTDFSARFAWKSVNLGASFTWGAAKAASPHVLAAWKTSLTVLFRTGLIAAGFIRQAALTVGKAFASPATTGPGPAAIRQSRHDTADPKTASNEPRSQRAAMSLAKSEPPSFVTAATATSRPALAVYVNKAPAVRAASQQQPAAIPAAGRQGRQATPLLSARSLSRAALAGLAAASAGFLFIALGPGPTTVRSGVALTFPIPERPGILIPKKPAGSVTRQNREEIVVPAFPPGDTATTKIAAAAPEPTGPLAEMIAFVAERPSTPSVIEGSDPVLATAEAVGGLEQFVRAAAIVGLERLLQPDGAYTIFVPNDAAFAKLAPGEIDDLLQPTGHERLLTLLSHHILPERLTFDQIAGDVRAYTSLAGQKMTIDATEVIRIGDAGMVDADIQANNGILHVIDQVLPVTEP